MCFIRVSPKHAPLNPPGAAPTLTSIYDKSFLDTTVDTENPTSQEIIKSLNVDEKLHPLRTESGEDIELQAARSLSVDEVREQTQQKASMPKGRRASRASGGSEEKHGKGFKIHSTTEPRI